jgi:hypothetical protein
MRLNEDRLRAIGLTRCEIEVAQLIMEGLNETEIAKKRFVVKGAISSLKTSMGKKLFPESSSRYKVAGQIMLRLAEIGYDRVGVPPAIEYRHKSPRTCGVEKCRKCKCPKRKKELEKENNQSSPK